MGFNRVFAAAAAAAMLGLAGCGPVDHSRVTVISEPMAFTGHTFAWQHVDAPPANSVFGAQAIVDNPIFRQQVEQAVNQAMVAKGYQLVRPEQAELLLGYHVGVQRQTRTETVQNPQSMGMQPMGPMVCGRYGCGPAFGWGWGWYGPPTTSTRQVSYTEGGLMLDISDAKTSQLVWRALYKNRVTANSATQANLDAVALQLTASLPPATPR